MLLRLVRFPFLLLVLLTVLLAACAPSTPAAPAQIVIGIVNTTPARDGLIESFKAELSRRGFVDGENVRYLYEGAMPDKGPRDAWAAQLVAQNVDLILGVTTPGAQSAAAATSTIPIVFVPVTDPVGAGLVPNLQTPGGNITGVTNGNPHPLRLRLMHDMDSSIRRIYMPINTESAPVMSSLESVRATAQELGMELIEEDLNSVDAIQASFATIPSDIDAIFITPDPVFASYSAEWVEVAKERGVPVSSMSTGEVENGVLMSYGENLTSAAEQAARMAEKVLNGTNPGSLPVETTEYFIAVNLATAQAIGLQVPDDIIRRASIVIRP